MPELDDPLHPRPSFAAKGGTAPASGKLELALPDSKTTALDTFLSGDPPGLHCRGELLIIAVVLVGVRA
jgi:hypothetical protein